MGLTTKTFVSGEEFLATFDPESPGCLILDVRMPGLSGLAVQERLSNEPLFPAVIIITAFAEIPTALRAMRQGAVEFLQKTCGETELLDAIHRAIAVDAQNRLDHARRGAIRARLALLTRQEREVFEQVVYGTANKTIAAALGISQRAVEDRRARLMRKLEVDNLADLVRLAIDAGGISGN
jgi:FixJ family two-component response regulator